MPKGRMNRNRLLILVFLPFLLETEEASAGSNKGEHRYCSLRRRECVSIKISCAIHNGHLLKSLVRRRRGPNAFLARHFARGHLSSREKACKSNRRRQGGTFSNEFLFRLLLCKVKQRCTCTFRFLFWKDEKQSWSV